jgi:DNA-directed RNA polymerase specialized sigma24 family protein
MSHLPKDWRFLRMAWIYAVILTGNAERASELVGSVLSEVGRRQDVVGARRRRGLFFAILRRGAGEAPRRPETDFAGPDGLRCFHELSEPGRSALALLYTRLFDPAQLADVLGVTEAALPDILDAARSELSTKLPQPA